METPKIKKTRASTSDEARRYRQQGHDDALMFANLIGLSQDYQNDAKAKKDVIDPSGDSHSLKGGQKKWQIFLYGLNRFQNDDFFRVMNGMGELLINCINAFPPKYEDYIQDKYTAKINLQKEMKEFAEKLRQEHRLRAFISKSMFNGGEVNYLTVFDKNIYHVFWGKEVCNVLSENLSVENSKARQAGQFDDQKVVFKYDGVNVGELEMRNDSPVHYREIRFNMVKPKVMNLLFSKIPFVRKFNDRIFIYGEADRKFGKWIKPSS